MTLKVEAPSAEEARALVLEKLPDGFELLSAEPAMTKGAASVIIEATAVRYGERREVEAPTLGQVREMVPDGWELLHVTRQ